MQPNSTDRSAFRPASILVLCGAMVAGCASNTEELLSHRSAPMVDVWRQHTASTGGDPAPRQVLDARLSLRRPLTPGDVQAAPAVNAGYTRTAENEIHSQFPRLPNPNLVMYVFPHLAGSEQAPVPGYSTVFPLHQRVHYALPGERVEDY